MEYSLFKDTEIVDTIQNIKDKLSEIGIHLKEDDINYNFDSVAPYSLRVTIDENSVFGSNGKGTSIKNAKASAYAEFMERLQNQNVGATLLFDGFMVAPDEKVEEEKNAGFNCIIKHEHNKKIILPFYSVKKQKIKYINNNFLMNFQMSNGMCAGNTQEEALVQGISEIFERYACRKVFSDKLKMPVIPQEKYLKYDKIRNIINFYEENGYKITVKDASLGKKLPVVCIVTEYSGTNLYSINFGSHPSLPIAIERCLTELSQGYDMRDKETSLNQRKTLNFLSETKFKFLKKSSVDFLYQFYRVIPVCEHIKELDELFFTDKSSYNFDENAWIDSDENKTNKDLLEFLYKNTYATTKGKIYVRDNSFLGFPSFYIYIKDVSYIIKPNHKKYIKYFLSYKDEYIDKIHSVEKLLDIIEFYIGIFPLLIATKSYEYLALLCALKLEDKSKINLYLRLLKEKNNYFELLSDFGAKIINLIDDYYNNNDFYNKYSRKDVQYFEKFRKNLSLNIIKTLLKQFNNINLSNSRKQDKTGIFNRIKPVLTKKYKENLPNQMNLKNIFDFV